MLFYTGFQRIASEVASTYVDNLSQKESSLNELRSMVIESVSILENESPISQIGKLLNHAWSIKRSLSPLISSNEIDDLYTAIISAGALGGKITGAGGGGFFLVFAEPSKQENIRQKLKKLLHVPFQFENQGCHILGQ